MVQGRKNVWLPNNHDLRQLKSFCLLFFFSFSKKAVENVQKLGKVCVLDIEIEGVKQVKSSHLNPILVFVEPPSVEELEQRLRRRNTETEESLQKRLNTAKIELEYGTTPGNFDTVIHNRHFKQAYNELRDFVLKELETQFKEGINVCLYRVELHERDHEHD